jgi:hypothetical protein
MRWVDEMGTRSALLAAALITLAAAAGCDRGAPTGPVEGCRPVRDLGKKSLDRWVDLNGKGPAPDAPLAAAAAHSEALAKTARDIGADFTRAAPKRPDLAETAEGVRMLGDLAGQKLAALAATVRGLDERLAPLQKLESTANDAVDALGKDLTAAVGCGEGAPPACAPVAARLKELEDTRVPGGFGPAAKVARTRGETFGALAAAVEALPPAPPRAKVRGEKVRHARDAAAAFRGLADALEAATPFEQRLATAREQAEEAMTRFTVELTAASELCGGGKPAASAAPATPAPSGSAR